MTNSSARLRWTNRLKPARSPCLRARTVIAHGGAVTYRPNHVADGHELARLADALLDDARALVRLVDVCRPALSLPGRRPTEDPEDETGRTASRGEPPRPTEEAAVDTARLRMCAEFTTGAAHLVSALAYVRGVSAALDRALSHWEGEAPAVVRGGLHDHPDGAAEYAG